MKGKKVRWGCCSNPDLGVAQTQIWVFLKPRSGFHKSGFSLVILIV
ncbi:hypothetical protein SLEP1_g59541, partial [Rubroshorea leprosula]